MHFRKETFAARYFLESPNRLNEKINMDFIHLQRLRNLRDQYGCSSLQCEKVQGGQLPSSPITRIIDQIADLEREIDRKLLEYDALLEDVKMAIFSCKDDREVKVLTKRFLEEKRVAVIAEEIYLSESQVYNLLDEALKKIDQYIKANKLKGYGNGTGQED